MQVFPRETTDYIAEQFFLYFDRQRHARKGLSPKDARTLIDFVGEPSPGRAAPDATDYSRTRVQGGGSRRPSEAEVCRIIEREQDRPAWDEVFGELLRRCEKEADLENFVMMVWRDSATEDEVCEEFGIERTTYYKRRLTVLCKAGILAVSKNIITA